MPDPELAYGMLSAASDDPFERAALRTRRGVRGRTDTGATEEFLRSLAIPQSPLEAGLMLAGPLGKGAGMLGGRLAGRAAGVLPALLGMGLESDEAQAGPASKVIRAGGKALAEALKHLGPKGEAIKGSAFDKKALEVGRELETMPKGAGPLDLSGNLRMDVPQRAIPRYEPSRGISPRMQAALENPEVHEGLRQSMQAGMQMGAEKWYHNDPIFQAWVSELGPVEGPREFARYMDYVAATSPRSDVPTNIRNASYYYVHGPKALRPEDNPYPYGHLAEDLHRSNIAGLQAAERGRGSVGAQFAPEFGGWDIFQNPKPVSFSQDLQGNLIPVAADTHAMRNVAMRTNDPRWLETQIQEFVPKSRKGGLSEFQEAYGTPKRTEKGVAVVYRPQDLVERGRMTLPEAKEVPSFWVGKPRENEYGAIENLYGDVSGRMQLSPGEGQSAAWSGAGELTGLGTAPDQTFPEMFNNRVLYTAMMRNENPQDTLRSLIRKQAPLLSVGGGGLLAPQLMELTGERQAQRQ
jgi:hypothetical protein